MSTLNREQKVTVLFEDEISPKNKPTREQREHAIRLADEFSNRMLAKYKRGQEEHGGNLWEKFSILELIDQALDETVDQAIYLLTLRDQQNECSYCGFNHDLGGFRQPTGEEARREYYERNGEVDPLDKCNWDF